MSDKYRTKVGIDVVEKVISLKEADQEFLTNKTILAYLGGVSKEFIKDLRETGVLPFYKVRNTIVRPLVASSCVRSFSRLQECLHKTEERRLVGLYSSSAHLFQMFLHCINTFLDMIEHITLTSGI